jgi:hypothetical protein
MSVWNGHYECACYHPLFVFNQFGDLERCALRPRNVHSADGWEAVLRPVVARYRGKLSRLYFRADAGFANPEVYKYLEGEGIKYAIRLPANRVLQERIGYLLKRPVGRPSLDVRRPYANFTYQAGRWTKDGVASLSDLVRSSLRLRPDRIPIGEVRGPEALDLLKAWGTGHPGGIGTIHAGSALGVPLLSRRRTLQLYLA